MSDEKAWGSGPCPEDCNCLEAQVKSLRAALASRDEEVKGLEAKVEAQAKAIQSALEHLDEYMEGQQNSPHKVQEVLLAALRGGGKL